jgi:predicted transcriptional regulator
MTDTRTTDEACTLRTVFLPISTDIALADIARRQRRGKQDVIREAVTSYLEIQREERRQPARS